MLYDQIDRNRRMTVMLFLAFAVVIAAIAWAVDVVVLGTGPLGAVIVGLVIAAASVAFAWFQASNVVLSASGAREPRADSPRERELVEIVEGVAIAANFPPPKVYVIDDRAPNAFATGRRPQDGVTVFTTGLLQTMNRAQTEAVVAHELSHIGNRDAMIGVTAAVLVGAVLIVCRLVLRMLFYGGGRRNDRSSGSSANPLMLVGLVVLVLAPVFAMLLRFAISRRRESLADANAVRLTRNPDAMIGALEVLAGDTTSVDFSHGLASNLWIEEPEAGEGSWLDRITSTHPPIPERIAALRGIAGDERYR